MLDNGVTPASEFRKAARKIIGPLPVSKGYVEIRKVRAYDLLSTGQLFASLEGIEDEKIAREQIEKKISQSDQLITIAQYFEIVKKGMTNPRMVIDDGEDLADDEIYRADLEDDDLIYIGDQVMQFSGYGGTAEAAPFSEEQGAGDIAASHGKGVRAAAKRAVEK